jgi:hypothetical protein
MAGRGPWVQTSFSLRFPRLGSGLGALESTVEMPRSMATGFERTRTVINTVIQIRFDFSASVRRNARKSLKFEILKFSSLSDQPIGQGVL